jgi:hypothetical protein
VAGYGYGGGQALGLLGNSGAGWGGRKAKAPARAAAAKAALAASQAGGGGGGGGAHSRADAAEVGATHVPEERPSVVFITACLMTSAIEAVRKTALGLVHALLDRASCGSDSNGGPAIKPGAEDGGSKLSSDGFSNLGGYSRISKPLVEVAGAYTKEKEDEAEKGALKEAQQHTERERKAGELVQPYILRLLAEGLVPQALRYVLLLYGMRRKSHEVVEMACRLAEKKKELGRYKTVLAEAESDYDTIVRQRRRHWGSRSRRIQQEMEAFRREMRLVRQEMADLAAVHEYEDGVGNLVVDRETQALALDILHMLVRGCLRPARPAVRRHLFVDVVGLVLPTAAVIEAVALFCTAGSVDVLCVLVCAADDYTLYDVAQTVVPHVLAAAVHGPLRKLVLHALGRIARGYQQPNNRLPYPQWYWGGLWKDLEMLGMVRDGTVCVALLFV